MKIHGIYYKSGAVVRVKIKSDDQSDPFPFQYAKIKDFYIYQDHKIFSTQKTTSHRYQCTYQRNIS